MTHESIGSRRLSTGALARVEGEGAMHIQITDGQLIEVQLNIYEPPRFFEGILRGRRFDEPSDITARICGICPVAYQMSACTAIEDAIGVVVDGPLRDLRRLLYCGEWIESHALHIHFLHAPDFLGYDSAIDMTVDHRAAVERGLEIKKIGNTILETIGGRAIHPVNVKVGGFYRVPTRRELQPLRDELERGHELALEAVDFVAGFDFPDHEMPYEFVSVAHPTEYPVLGDRVVSDRGLDEIDDAGLVASAQIIPPTSQNQATIEKDLFEFVQNNLELDDETLRRRSEVTIRNHDPCISCATHFLDLTVDRS